MTHISQSELDRIKAENSPLDVVLRYGLELKKRQGRDHVALCPFHDDRTPSFAIRGEDRPGRPPFKCFGCGWSGDVIRFIQHIDSVDFRTACERLGAAVDGAPASVEERAQRARERRVKQRQAEERERIEKENRRKAWPPFEEGSDGTLQELADLRSVSFTAVKLTWLSGILRFCEWKGHRSWIIGDSKRTCAQARRLDGHPWGNGENTFKAWTLPGSELKPIGLTKHPLPVIICEGGPDLLACWHFLHAGRRCAEFQPVCMLGASARLGRRAEWLKGREVWIAPDNDPSGKDAAQRWESEALEAGALGVGTFALGAPDLNDLTKSHDWTATIR